MLTLNINGKEEKLNIGCRTFVSLYELLHLLEMPSDTTLSVQVNHETILPRTYVFHTIYSGDQLTIDENL